MTDVKVREELEAAIKRGNQAKETLAKLDALDAVERASDVERFQKLSSSERAEIRRKHPEHYQTMWEQVREKAEQTLVEKSGR